MKPSHLGPARCTRGSKAPLSLTPAPSYSLGDMIAETSHAERQIVEIADARVLNVNLPSTLPLRSINPLPFMPRCCRNIVKSPLPKFEEETYCLKSLFEAAAAEDPCPSSMPLLQADQEGCEVPAPLAFPEEVHPSYRQFRADSSTCRMCLHVSASGVDGSGLRGRTSLLDCTRRTCARG
jgi:hypothetical protein